MISLITMAVPTADGLYRWHVQIMEQRPDPVEALSSQRKRFTPSQFALQLQARTLTPIRDGRWPSLR